VLLAAAAILVPRLDRDELAHPLDHPVQDHPATGEPSATDASAR
jgi:hypothetical protein